MFEVPLLINTGDIYLGTFDIYVSFDSAILSIGEPTNAVRFNQDKTQVGSSELALHYYVLCVNIISVSNLH